MPTRKIKSLFFLFYTIALPIFLYGNVLNPLRDYLLPEDHPLQKKIKYLFRDENLFNTPESFNSSGFRVLDRVNRGLMVASHPTVKNYLFKKFQNHISQPFQLENYLRRIRGARALENFIASEKLQHITVPKKWLYPLPKIYSDPKTIGTTYILIVEEIDICSGGKDPKGEVAKKYYNIDKKILKELCLVLFKFRGLDSRLHNVPFTYRNKVAFIDTERWEEQRKEYLPYILPFMSRERQRYAKAILKSLGADVE